jgi:hypothetical protein
MSELQGFSNEGENYGKNDDAYDFKKDTEAFKSWYRDDVALDTNQDVHISGARLDDNNKLFNEIWENIIKMGKTARLIGRIKTARLIGRINTDGLIELKVSRKGIEQIRNLLFSEK